MKQSLTYYITIFIIKLIGIKKYFSKDPINFKKLRKRDIHHPHNTIFKNNLVRTFRVLNTPITEVKRNKISKNLLIFIHGGAFILGPSKHHWDTIEEIAKQTNHTIWICDYPKAPESKISVMSENMDLVYNTALCKFPSNQISLMGDSVGGTLAIALTQRLVHRKVKLPIRMMLISPVMDATLSNPQIGVIDKIDVMLSKKGLYSAMKMCAENNDLKNVMISPINGSFDQFPNTILFLGENDITYPDQQLVIQKLIKASVNIEVIVGNKMPHIWPLLPFMKEAKIALKEKIIDRLNS